MEGVPTASDMNEIFPMQSFTKSFYFENNSSKTETKVFKKIIYLPKIE